MGVEIMPNDGLGVDLCVLGVSNLCFSHNSPFWNESSHFGSATPPQSRPGSPSKPSELYFMMVKTLTNVNVYGVERDVQSHMCRPTMLFLHVRNGRSGHVWMHIMFLAIRLHVSSPFGQCVLVRTGVWGALPPGRRGELSRPPMEAGWFGGPQAPQFYTSANSKSKLHSS